MINRIRIKNIESHEDTEIKLGDFTLICGTSGTGKSAFIRALESLFFFTLPAVRYDEETASISLEGDEGEELSRVRRDKVEYSCYACGYSEGNPFKKCPSCHGTKTKVVRKKMEDTYTINGKEYKKMGKGLQNLDDDIKAQFPVAMIQLDDGTTVFPGFKGQFDQFIFRELSAANMNRLLSILEGNDIVEQLTKHIKKEILSDGKTKQFLEDEFARIEVELEVEKRNLDEVEENYEDFEQRNKLIGDSYSKLMTLVDIYRKLQTHGTNRRKLLEEISTIHVIDVTRLSENILRLENLFGIKTRLQSLQHELGRIQAELCDEGMLFDSDKLTEMCKNLKNLWLSMKDHKEKSKELMETNAEIYALDRKIEFVKNEIYEKCVKQGICPFSGFEISDECKNRLVGE